MPPHTKPTNPTASPARAAAFDILLRVERESSYASELLHSATYADLSTPDHALATELVMGTLRWRSRLDNEITTASSKSLTKLDLEVIIALRLALYQFRFLDRIPQRAALYESVELVKRARKRSAAPFVNTILRKLADREKSASNFAYPAGNETLSPELLARSFAHPLWLVERWTREYGLDAAQGICQHDQSVPATAIRLRDPIAIQNTAQLDEEGIALTPGALLTNACRVTSGDITKAAAFHSGQIVIQDEASQLVAALVSAALPNTQARVLDCCAAPGGKTLAITDRNLGASITAVELHPRRARLLQKLVGAANPTAKIKIIAADAQHLPISIHFDRILADVPCSGTGTLARNPEIKWRLTANDLTQLHGRQTAILRAALAQLVPGGRLVYSTCSLEKEENEHVVEEVLAQQNSFRRVECQPEIERLKAAGELTWPDPANLTQGPYLRTIPGIHHCDGFFAAILERI